MQGSVISLNQEKDMGSDIIKFVNDENGFVREITINKNKKPATIFMEFIRNLDTKPKDKLLVK